MRVFTILFFLVLCFSWIAQAQQNAQSVGKGTYDTHCAQCHGYEGDGKGYAFDNVFPKPRDFTSGMFKIRMTPTGEEPLLDDLYHIISRGIYRRQNV